VEGIYYCTNNIETIKKNTDILIDASREVGQEENVERTKFMLVSHHQNTGQSQDIRMANGMSEHVSEFIYLGTAVTSQNLIQEEIETR
jgi:hypothetical protein